MVPVEHLEGSRQPWSTGQGSVRNALPAPTGPGQRAQTQSPVVDGHQSLCVDTPAPRAGRGR